MKTLEQLANEGELFYNFESEMVREQLYSIIVEAAEAARIGRQLVDVIPLNAGHALKMNIADDDAVSFRQTAEGAEFSTDVETYAQATITPNLWANLVVVSRTMQEDSNWDLVKRNIKRMGVRAGVKEDYIVFNALNDSTNGFPAASTTLSGSSVGHDYSSAGTELSIADLVGAAKLVRSNNMRPNVIAIHPEQLAELQQIDSFLEADKFGRREMHIKGTVGRIIGMDVLTSTTSWIEQTSTSYAWVLDNQEAGALIMRRPLTMRTFDLPSRDSLGVAASFRAEARCLKSDAGVRITVS